MNPRCMQDFSAALVKLEISFLSNFSEMFIFFVEKKSNLIFGPTDPQNNFALEIKFLFAYIGH